MAAGIEPVAIVGMECIFPGAPNLAAFWRNIILETNCLTTVPPERWNRAASPELPPRAGRLYRQLYAFRPAGVRCHARRSR